MLIQYGSVPVARRRGNAGRLHSRDKKYVAGMSRRRDREETSVASAARRMVFGGRQSTLIIADSATALCFD
jgi:hypothetical protein